MSGEVQAAVKVVPGDRIGNQAAAYPQGGASHLGTPSIAQRSPRSRENGAAFALDSKRGEVQGTSPFSWQGSLGMEMMR